MHNIETVSTVKKFHAYISFQENMNMKLFYSFGF